MPRAIASALREELVRRHLQGCPLVQIAQDLGLRYGSVRLLWRRFLRRGPDGLRCDYDRCGWAGLRFPAEECEAALALRREHPRWGAGLIRLQWGAEPAPSCRTLQRWFRAGGLTPVRRKRPPVERRWGRVPHEVWQLDAKEQMHLADGTGTSVLAATDEASGAVLGASVFPPGLLEASSGVGCAGGSARPV